MSHEPDIFGYLATTKISGITTELLDDSTKNSYAAKKNVPFWKGPISIWATVRASRTYPAGLPIPEEGAIEELVLADAGTGFFQPPGTEIWLVLALKSTGTMNVALTDGAAFVLTHTGTAVSPESPIYLTNSLYYAIINGSGGESTTSIAYQKLSR